MSFRIVHVAHAAEGGAGRAALRASLACRSVGLESTFAYATGELADPNGFKLRYEPARQGAVATLRDKLQWGLVHRTHQPGYSLFSIPYPGLDLEAHPTIAAADIIHLHWPTWTVTPPMIRRFLDAGKPVFVTLHDMWMFSGGCHYAGDCRQFRTGCMKCPQIADGLGLANAAFEDKLACYGGGHPLLHVVALCPWMRDLAQESRILGQSPIHLIPNPIEIDVFAPGDRHAHRADLGVGPGDAVLLFGNYDNSETRKGSDILKQALETFAASPTVAAFPGKIFLMSFGRHSRMQPPSPLRQISLGSINDDEVLARIYGIADMLCFPSIEDNYPNSIIEAAACGTPSVAFRTGGMADMVRHGETGLLVDPLGDPSAFAKALETALSALFRKETVRTACRDRVLEINTPEGIGARLAQAYSSALPAKPPHPIGDAAKPIDPTSVHLRAQVTIEEDSRLGIEFARFPVSRFLHNNNGGAALKSVAQYRRHDGSSSKRLRVMTVRAFHEHHSAHSGPYQFLRWLPMDQFELCNIVVPFGADLASPEVRERTEELGTVLGASPLGGHPNTWAAEWEIARRLREDRFDVVHFIDGELGGALISRLPDSVFAEGVRPALMAMLHQPAHLARQWTSAAMMKRFDMLGAVADIQARDLREWVPGADVAMVPHGIDIDFFHPGSTPPPREPGAPLRLLAVGQWLRDYELAFAAVDRLTAEGVDIDYRVVTKPLDNLRLPNCVTLLSGLTDQELRDEYRAADIVFMPLSYATANNALLESMACGTPVISTAIGGVPEYVPQEAGRLCAPEVEACVAALRELAENPELRQRMAAAARQCAERFDWRRIAERYGEIYTALAAARKVAAQ